MSVGWWGDWMVVGEQCREDGTVGLEGKGLIWNGWGLGDQNITNLRGPETEWVGEDKELEREERGYIEPMGGHHGLGKTRF